MNENSGGMPTPTGTPNPLNPTPLVQPETPEQPEMMAQPFVAPEPTTTAASGQQPTTQPEASQRPVRRVTIQDVRPMQQPEQPAPLPAQPIAPTPVNEEVMIEETIAEIVPEPRETQMPIPKDSVVEPAKKKKKTGLIALIVLMIAAIGAAVVALVIIKPWQPKDDKVPTAISKLMSANAPEKISLKGTVTMVPSDNLSAFSALVVDFDSGMNLKSDENFVNANVTATLQDGNEFKFDVEEVHTMDGDLYLRLSGLSEALTQYAANSPVAVAEQDEPTMIDNCISDPSGMTNCMTIAEQPSIFDSLGVFEVVDDEWIRIPDSGFSNTTDIFDMDTPIACLVDAAGNLDDFGTDFTTKYNANQFITYSTENLKISKKTDTLYRLGFDDEKLAAFINSMTNSGFMNSLIACTGGTATSSKTTAAAVAEITKNLPALYAEIDSNDNFTRLYFTITTDTASATVDVAIGYPKTVTIDEPEYYIDLGEVLQSLLEQFYGGSLTEEW